MVPAGHAQEQRCDNDCAAGKDPVGHLHELLGPDWIIDLKATGIDYPNDGVEELLPTMRNAN